MISQGIPIAFLVGIAFGLVVGFAVGWLVRGTDE